MRENTPLVITPTYNEADNIIRLASCVFSLPSGFDLLVIDDGSPDATSQLVKKHPEFQRRLHLIERSKKLGLGTAYIKGFLWALERGYPFVCQMDADFSHDPNDLERLIHAAASYDLVLGSRYIQQGGVKGWARHRELLSRTANWYARTVLGISIFDLTGGFKCYRKKTLEGVDWNKIRSEGYAFQIETTARVFRRGFRVVEIPIVFKEREFGKSKISRKIIWEALGTVIRLKIFPK